MHESPVLRYDILKESVQYYNLFMISKFLANIKSYKCICDGLKDRHIMDYFIICYYPVKYIRKTTLHTWLLATNIV